MTLSSILADLYRRLGYASSPAAEVTTRLTAFMNEAVAELYAAPGMGEALSRHDPSLTFVTVASTPTYALPPGVSRVDAVRETTNDRRLVMRTHDWYRSALPDPSAISGTPEAWIPLGFGAVALQPSAAAEIFVKSTSAADTTQTAYIEGIRTGGYPSSLSKVLTGTTAVTFSAALADFISITKFYISAVGAGTITLHQTSGAGTELARIPIGETFSRYQTIALYPTPASAITYTVDGERDLPDMANATDEPPFPRRFHRLLVDYALWKEWEKKDDTRANDAARRYAKGVSDLRYFVTCPPDYLPSRGDMRPERSRFGAWTPVTRY